MSSTNSIIYRLKSSTNFGTVNFEGPSLRGAQLFPLIAQKLGCSEAEFDVFLGEKRLSVDEEVRAYAQVIVSRKLADPSALRAARGAGGANRGGRGGRNDPQVIVVRGTTHSGGGLEQLSASSGVPVAAAAEEMTEDERIMNLGASVIEQTAPLANSGRGRGFAPFNSARGGRGGMGFDRGGGPSRRPPPADYICHACGRGGHYIEDCDVTRSDTRRLAAPVGIAESKLETVDPADASSARFVTRDGRFVRRKIEGTTLAGVSSATTVSDDAVPEELKCGACGHLLKDAVRLHCCDVRCCSACVDARVEASIQSGDVPSCMACEAPIDVDDGLSPDEERRAAAKALLRSHQA